MYYIIFNYFKDSSSSDLDENYSDYDANSDSDKDNDNNDLSTAIIEKKYEKENVQGATKKEIGEFKGILCTYQFLI